MSDRLRTTWLLIALSFATPAAAQQRAAEDALQARIDSLRALHAAAQAALDSAETVARRRRLESGAMQLDTQRVGVVTVISPSGVSRPARTHTERALRRFDSLASDESSPLAGLTLLIESGRSVAAFDDMMKQPGHRRVWLPPVTAAPRRTDAVAREITKHLVDELPADMRQWVRGGISFRADERRLVAVYRALIVNPARAVVSCRAGDPHACAAALGLRGPGPLWSEWYTRDQLLRWASTQNRSYSYARERLACFDDLAQVDCDRLAAEGGGPPAPLPIAARSTLLTHALERGGVDAYLALRADSTGPIVDRLARVAGVSPDELLRGWHARVMASRPQFAAGLGGSWIVTILWAVALSWFAMRSKRWRLG